MEKFKVCWDGRQVDNTEPPTLRVEKWSIAGAQRKSASTCPSTPKFPTKEVEESWAIAYLRSGFIAQHIFVFYLIVCLLSVSLW